MSKTRQTLEARRLFSISDILGNRHLIDLTVGSRHQPIMLSLEQIPDYRMEKAGGATFPKKRADSPNRFRIHHMLSDDTWETIDLPETLDNLHAVQPLGDGQWLLVRSRADNDADRNAHVFDNTARHKRSFHAGDGIHQVQTTEDGRIWLSYFDEGVFGNTKLAQSGLVCLDDRGRCLFEYATLVGSNVPPIADCYALNVTSSREVWICYYMDFPLVHLIDGKPESVWRGQPISGSPGFAISGELLLFAGGYTSKNDLFLVQNGTGKKKTITPVDSKGQPVRSFAAFGRNDRLFLRTKDSLFVIQVSDAE